MTNKEQIAADLFSSFQDFQSNAPTPGGSANANKYVADKLADAIGDGIERGSRISFKGAKTVAEINYLPSDQKQAGDMYLCTTSGRLDGKNPLEVNENTAVIWDGVSWSKFIEIDLSDYYTKAETDAHMAAAVSTEATARADADTALGGRIDAEATARENADDTLQGNLDAEEASREDADATLQSNIESEATEREQADGELQAQIDAISSRSDVVDVVASYAELVAYDTSTLADNDVIKVLADETHEDAIAYYRWSTTTEAWSFIGSQGPYYTISETDTLLAGKAPTNHASTATTYGVGDATKYGHVKVDSALSSSSTNPVQNKVVKAALDGKLDKSGGKMTGPLLGYFTSSRETVIGNEYNVLLNAKNRGVTFTQSGSGQLSDSAVWNLFDGRIEPQYSGTSIDQTNPYVLEIDVASLIGNTHCQVFSAFGWTCRYWEPIRFKVELYDTYQSINEWVTICDYSQTNFSGQYSGGSSRNLFVKFGSGTQNPHTGATRGGIFRKIRITIYKGGEASNRWGISEIFFWYPEAQRVFQGIAAFSATRLETAHNLKVNLASESAQSFDGSANAESIGVAGTLPITHGGTGATTAAAARTNLGLGNVENESVSNGTPDFTEASTRTNIASGEKMSVLFGKIKKWFTDLKAVAFTGSYNDLTDKPTIPAGQVQSDWNETGTSAPSFIKNKPQNLVQDASYVHTDNDYTTAEKNKLAGIDAGAQVNNIFVAVYNGNNNHAGNTPYADIYAAYQDGKRLMCWNSASNALRLYTLNGFNATDKIFKFTSCGGSGEDILEVSFAYLEGNINSTECQAKNYLLAKRNHASSDTTYGTGTSSNYGHVKLSASTSSTSGVNDGVAATPSAVKAAYDLANSKYSKLSGGIPYSDMSSGVKASLDKADTALQQHQSLDGYVNNIQADSTTTFGDTSTIVVGKSGKNVLTRTALALYNYIKGKLAAVAVSGSYNDLSNKPSIPAAQVNSDWNATSGVAQILNKPQNLVQDASYVHTDNNYSTSEKDKLAGIADGADKSHVKFFSYVADYADIAAAMPYASSIYNVFLVGKEDGTYPRSYALVKFDRTDGVMVFAAMRDDSTLCTITKTRARGTGWSYHDYPLAPQSHASSDTTYGTGTSSNYGHVKLSDSTSSTSGVNDSVAATPSAVKAAYDLANNKMGKVSSAVENNLASFNSSGQVMDSGSSKDLLKMVGNLFSKSFGSSSTAVGCRVLRLPATSDFHTSSFIVRITNRNSNSGASARFGEIYAILSVSHRGSYFHMSFNSLSAKRFDGRMYASSTYVTPNENTWRVGYKQVTVSGVNYYDIYLWAVIGNSAVTIPFTEIYMTPFDNYYNDGASVVMEDITAAPSVDDYWSLRYPVTHNMDVTGGSEDRPAYVNANGEVQQGNLIINRGSHSTVTLDFTGTLGSNANTWYFV